MPYIVVYYTPSYNGANVLTAGTYINLNDAVVRLLEMVPDYTEHINNTVKNCDRIGWINYIPFGDTEPVSVTSPKRAVYLFSTDE